MHGRPVQKDIHELDNHDGVITHLEPDILECEVKWALESMAMNRASGGDGIPVELFQILKDDAVKVLHSVCQQIWKTAVVTRLEKVSFHSNPKEGQCQRVLKLLDNCTHLTYDQPSQHIKKQRHYFANKVHLIKGMVFPVVMYGCES